MAGASSRVRAVVAALALLCCLYLVYLAGLQRGEAGLALATVERRAITHAPTATHKHVPSIRREATQKHPQQSTTAQTSTSDTTATPAEAQDRNEDQDQPSQRMQGMHSKRITQPHGEGDAADRSNDDLVSGNQNRYPVSPVRPKRYWPHHDLRKDGLYPRLIGIGCQKCGTSSLAVYLGYVQGFTMSGAKEVHAFRGDRTHNMFSRDPLGAGKHWMLKSLKWYQSKWGKRGLYIECNRETFRCVGNAARNATPFEITPRYLTDYRVPFNMWESLPSPRQIKFVLMLRNPTSRTWSAYFQTMKRRQWNTTTFLSQTREEMHVLRACYNATVGYTTQSSALRMGERLPGMQSLHMCREPRSVYRDLQTCVRKHNPDSSHPWFLHYTQIEMDGMADFPLHMKVQYEGIVMRGIYADQLFNFLCAGFWPEQFLVMTAGELRTDPRAAMRRITAFMDVPYHLTSEKWFDKGVSRMKKSSGAIPEEIVPELEELFAPHNRLLMRLLLGNRFNVNPRYLLREFKLDADPEFEGYMAGGRLD